MKSIPGLRQNSPYVNSFRRHSECVPSTPVRPTHRRSKSDGLMSYSGRTDLLLNPTGHEVDGKKSKSQRRLCTIIKFLLSKMTIHANRVTKSRSSSIIQHDNSDQLDAFERCLLYKQKASTLWCKNSLCSINSNTIITYVVVFALIGCVVYDIRLCYIILHLWIILGLLKDVQNSNSNSPDLDKISLHESIVAISAAKRVRCKSYSHCSFKDDLSWLWRVRPRTVYLDVLPSSLNLYFQNSENRDASDSMNIEWLRLQSFAADRSITVRPIRFARAGFYHTGTSDEVRCYSCGKRRSNWVAGEDPDEIHKQISPRCRHVNGTDDTNIAIPRDIDNTHSSEDPMAASQLQSRNDEKHPLRNENLNVPSGRHQNWKPTSTVTINNNSGACRGHDQLSNAAIRNTESHQENPSIEQHINERDDVHRPVSHPRQPYPHVTNHLTTHAQSNGYPAYPSASHGSPNDRTPHMQSNHHANVIQNGHSFEQARVSNGRRAANAAFTAQVNANSSPALNQPDRPSAHNGRRNMSRSTSGSSSVSDSVVQKLAPLGVNFDKPRYPAYAILTVRMSSYSGWSGSQTANLMADAGFVYAGYADYTRCFFCGGGLRNWEDGDDPWVEHARWFPRCAYLRQNKGDAFIRLVHERLDAQGQVNETGGDKSQGKVCGSPTEELLTDKEVDELAAFQSVVQQGYSPDLARQVVRQLWTKGISDVHSTDILAEMFRINEGECNEGEGSTDDPRLLNTHSEGVPNTNSEDSEDREVRRLVEENRRLKREKICRICEEEDASIAFLPCAHLVCCHVCAQAVRRCPVCGVIIQGTIKTWLT